MATMKLCTVLAALLVAIGVFTNSCSVSHMHGLARAQPWTSTVCTACTWVQRFKCCCGILVYDNTCLAQRFHCCVTACFRGHRMQDTHSSCF